MVISDRSIELFWSSVITRSTREGFLAGPALSNTNSFDLNVFFTVQVWYKSKKHFNSMGIGFMGIPWILVLAMGIGSCYRERQALNDGC